MKNKNASHIHIGKSNKVIKNFSRARMNRIQNAEIKLDIIFCYYFRQIFSSREMPVGIIAFMKFC